MSGIVKLDFKGIKAKANRFINNMPLRRSEMPIPLLHISLVSDTGEGRRALQYISHGNGTSVSNLMESLYTNNTFQDTCPFHVHPSDLRVEIQSFSGFNNQPTNIIYVT